MLKQNQKHLSTKTIQMKLPSRSMRCVKFTYKRKKEILKKVKHIM